MVEDALKSLAVRMHRNYQTVLSLLFAFSQNAQYQFLKRAVGINYWLSQIKQLQDISVHIALL